MITDINSEDHQTPGVQIVHFTFRASRQAVLKAGSGGTGQTFCYSVLWMISNCWSNRLGETGAAVPSSCAKREILNSSIIHR